jgi:hypothetical protein
MLDKSFAALCMEALVLRAAQQHRTRPHANHSGQIPNNGNASVQFDD